MIGKFLWGAAWRTLAFSAVVGAGLWFANRGPDWNGQDLIAAGDARVEGKAGVLVVALVQPGRFDQRFYSNFVDKIFTQAIPWPINVLAGADTGIVLLDPDRPFQQNRFAPIRLADIWGREKDVDGIPWVEKFRRGQLRWEKPSATLPDDFGFYLYPERKQGMRTAAAKTVAKVRYIYYPRLPGGFMPHEEQSLAMVKGALAQVKAAHPVVAAEMADAFDPYQKQLAVFRVLDAGADTLVLASTQPIYSDFEELSGSFVGVHKAVEEWRARNGGKAIKIVIPPHLASRPAFDRMLLEHFASTVPPATKPGQSAVGILSLHGMPVSLVGQDSWSGRVSEIERRLKPRIEEILRAKGYAHVKGLLASEGFADSIEDPDNKQVSVHEAFRNAQRDGAAVAVAVPIEFLSENSDSLFAHAALMFEGFPGYSTYMGPPTGTDWQKPYVREFQLGNTRVIYGGAPGGQTVPRQSQVMAEAIGSVFPQ